MEYVLRETERALELGLWGLALQSCISVPDVAGALESNGWSDPAKYAAWFDRHVGPVLNKPGGPMLDGETCYRFRCALLHQGAVEDQKKEAKRYRRLVFIEPGAPIAGHMNVMGDALNLDIPIFCFAVLRAASNWWKEVDGKEPFESNLAKCVQRRPNGYPPFFVGVPVIA